MKWKVAAGLLLALAGWSRFSKDLRPADPLFKDHPPTQEDCPDGYVKFKGNCIPKEHLTQ